MPCRGTSLFHGKRSLPACLAVGCKASTTRTTLGHDAPRSRGRCGTERVLDVSTRAGEVQRSPGRNVRSSTSSPHEGALCYDFRSMRLTRITVDPRRMGGVPCIRELRIPVATVVAMFAERMSEDEILDAYPDLEPEDIAEALGYAALALQERELPLLTGS